MACKVTLYYRIKLHINLNGPQPYEIPFLDLAYAPSLERRSHHPHPWLSTLSHGHVAQVAQFGRASVRGAVVPGIESQGGFPRHVFIC